MALGHSMAGPAMARGGSARPPAASGGARRVVYGVGNHDHFLTGLIVHGVRDYELFLARLVHGVSGHRLLIVSLDGGWRMCLTREQGCQICHHH
uniref:Uncharacterized protein n=1 Tax=Oryza sativa subsp. japonica TaxID=39947 RepID=Q6ZKW5_ORYSJ|nr:hypothetical protein [Oryza sativa Japonica Group]